MARAVRTRGSGRVPTACAEEDAGAEAETGGMVAGAGASKTVGLLPASAVEQARVSAPWPARGFEYRRVWAPDMAATLQLARRDDA
jgi:hypothetical protein